MTALLAAAIVGVATVMLVLGWVAMRRDPLKDIAADDLAVLNRRGRRQLDADAKQRLGRPLGAIVARIGGSRLAATLDDLIERAGRADGTTVQSFFDEVGYYVLLTGGLAVLLLPFGLPPWGALVLICIGLFGPFYVLWGTAQERQDQIDRDLPDFLDVLAVVVSAGVGFQSALDRVSKRYGGPLGEEMQLALQGMTVGEGFRVALGGVRDRTRSESVDQFVTALLQAEELGSPLTESLNQIAVDVRREASESEKRRAAKAAPKATIITILVLMPPTMAIMVYGTLVAIRG